MLMLGEPRAGPLAWDRDGGAVAAGCRLLDRRGRDAVRRNSARRACLGARGAQLKKVPAAARFAAIDTNLRSSRGARLAGSRTPPDPPLSASLRQRPVAP